LKSVAISKTSSGVALISIVLSTLSLISIRLPSTSSLAPFPALFGFKAAAAGDGVDGDGGDDDDDDDGVMPKKASSELRPVAAMDRLLQSPCGSAAEGRFHDIGQQWASGKSFMAAGCLIYLVSRQQG